MTEKKKKLIIIASVILVVALAFSAALLFGNKGLNKTFTLNVQAESFNADYEITSRYKTLGDCLKNNGYVVYAEENGTTTVKSVNAITADTKNGEYWCFYLNDEPLEDGIQNVKVHNGDSFKAKLIK